MDKIEELKSLAEKNDNNAQYELANIYFYGKNGVKENEKEAFYWFRQAAINGHKEAFEFLESKAVSNPVVPIAAMEFIYCLFMLSDKEENKIKLEKIANSESSIAIIAKFYIGKIEFNKENYKKAFGYLKEVITGGLKEALKFVEEQAEKNNVCCQEFLGEIYLNGSIEQTTQKAFYWYRRAVENGSELSFDILNKYSNRNDCYAQYELANIYYMGTKSIQQNYEQATKLYVNFTQSVNEGKEDIFNDVLSDNNTNSYLKFAIGQYYLTKNRIEEGFKLLIKSANQNNNLAIDFLNNFLENGDSNKQYIVACLIEENVFEKQEILKSIDLYIKSAEYGNTNAIQKIFDYYKSKDKNSLINFCLKISEDRKIISNNRIQCLIDIYLEEKTTIENKEKIIKTFSYFASCGNEKARKFIKRLNIQNLTEAERKIIGLIYYNTSNLVEHLRMKKLVTILLLLSLLISIVIGVYGIYMYIPKGSDYEKAEIYYSRKSYKNAFKFYSKAAEQGDADAQYKLGKMFCYDEGKISKLYTGYGGSSAAYYWCSESAYKWLTKAAEQGNADAQYEVGKLLYFWDGKLHNPTNKTFTKALAYRWLTKAAEQGNTEAEKFILKEF